jgi:acid phosphatase
MHEMLTRTGLLVAAIAAAVGVSAACDRTARVPGKTTSSLDQIQTVVVIYAENRAFDNLYGSFPGAEGLQSGASASYAQVDRDGTVLKELPPIWTGLTALGVTPPVTEAQTAHLPNQPFAIDDPKGFNRPSSVMTRDLVHRFYQHQMQIDGGKNDRFVAYGDSGALVMGHYDGSQMALWNIAKQYTLADHFFMGAFGSSFLNHFWLICACTPIYPNADQSPAKDQIATVEPDGVTLSHGAKWLKSALDGPADFKDGNLTPDFFAVNTMWPPYQPSVNTPAPTGDPAYADPTAPTTLPPQIQQTIGDLLSAKGVSWAWYSGAWQAAVDGKNAVPVPNFQYHHQPFNYFASMAPGTPARGEHLRDGGLNGTEFLKAIDVGTLQQVVFYKPQGNLNEHAGYADVLSGDRHIASVLAHLQTSPQWSQMMVVIAYDENGGFWDHVAPPKGDRWGPGSRVPAVIVSPFAKKGFVDHTLYDTTSILRFITRRFGLPMLPGLQIRDKAFAANGGQALGDLTNALDFSH